MYRNGFYDTNEATQTRRGGTPRRGRRPHSYDYEAFGKVYGTPTENLAQPFRFTGRAWDPESSLYYYRARNYAAAAGAFLSRDPVQFMGVYRYVSNLPTYFIDPWGLMEYLRRREHSYIYDNHTGVAYEFLPQGPGQPFGSWFRHENSSHQLVGALWRWHIDSAPLNSEAAQRLRERLDELAEMYDEWKKLDLEKCLTTEEQARKDDLENELKRWSGPPSSVNCIWAPAVVLDEVGLVEWPTWMVDEGGIREWPQWGLDNVRNVLGPASFIVPRMLIDYHWFRGMVPGHTVTSQPPY